MSRSRKKTPVTGNTCAVSDKWWKRLANRIFRRREKQAIHHGDEPPVDLDEVSDSWCMPKDGKQRFDPEDWPQFMRK